MTETGQLRHVLVCRFAWLTALGFLSACTGTKDATGVTASVDVLWSVASALRPTGSLINDVEATDSLYFVGGALEIAALRLRDGALVWKRSDVTSRPPLPVGDSLLVVLSAGESVGLRQRDGAILWRTPVSGTASTVFPVLVDRYGVFANYDGDLFAADVYTGAVRKLAAIHDLTASDGQIWSFAVRGDTVLVIAQSATVVGNRLPIWLTRVLPRSGAVISSQEVLSTTGTFANAFPPILSESLLVIPLGGSVGAVNLRSNQFQWTAGRANVTSRIAVRDGRVYAGTGNGTIMVYDVTTGAVLRKLALNMSGIDDIYPCREGIEFTSGAIFRVMDQPGATVQTLYPNPPTGGFTYFIRRNGVLATSASRFDVAVRCT